VQMVNKSATRIIGFDSGRSGSEIPDKVLDSKIFKFNVDQEESVNSSLGQSRSEIAFAASEELRSLRKILQNPKILGANSSMIVSMIPPYGEEPLMV
jgi:hypothetical protein